MEVTHGFFIIEKPHLSDLPGLMQYLAIMINKQLQCLFCDTEKDFKSPEAVRQHMLDKGHCFMNIDILTDFYMYYDFSKALTVIKEETDQELN